MTYSIDETHDPNLQSWVESANDPQTDFPIQNLPYGLFALGEDEMPAIGVAIGDQVLNLSEVSEYLWADDFDDLIADACSWETFDLLLTLEVAERRELRRRISNLLRADNHSRARDVAEGCVVPRREVELLLPVEVGDYTDFYASVYHATN